MAGFLIIYLWGEDRFPRQKANLYKPAAVGINAKDRGSIVGNLVAQGRCVLRWSGEGDERLFTGGWPGYDFSGISLAAFVLRRSEGKELIYPASIPPSREEAQQFSRSRAERWGTNRDLSAAGMGLYMHPPLPAAALSRCIGSRTPQELLAGWNGLNRLALPFLWVLCLWILWRAYGSPAVDTSLGRGMARGMGDALVVAILVVFNFPLWWGMIEGSSAGILLTCLAALCLLFLLRGNDKSFGLVFGLAMLAQPQLLMMLPWLVWRRRIRAFSWSLLFGAGWMALSLYWAGWTNHVRFLGVTLPWAMQGDAYFVNQSLSGLWRRLFESHSFLQLSPLPPPQWVSALNWISGAAAIGLGLMLVALLCRRPPDAPRVAMEYAALLLVGLAVSPAAWEHPHSRTVLVWVLLYGALRYRLTGWRRGVGLGLFLAGIVLGLVAFPNWEFTSWVQNILGLLGINITMATSYRLGLVLVSYPLFSLVLAALLILMGHRSPEAGQEHARKRSFSDWDTLSEDQRRKALQIRK
jgi:hypothetical protein